MLQAGQKVYAAPTGKLDPASGLPVYEGSCGLEFVPGFVDMLTAFAVPQAKNIGGTPVFGMARCNQHQALNQWRVVAIPQGKSVGGVPLYAFVCCPGQVQSGSGSGSGFGPAFHFPQHSGSGSGSGSGAVVGNTTCCPQTIIPSNLHLTITGGSCAGTYVLLGNDGGGLGTTCRPTGWINNANTWSYFNLVGGGGGNFLGFRLDCTTFGWQVDYFGGNDVGCFTLNTSLLTVSCSPFSISGSGTGSGFCGAFTFTITF